MKTRLFFAAVTLTLVVAVGPVSADAQPLGTFRWQLQPYCNVVTVAVTQNGGVYRLEGTDDQCGAGGASASVIGTAFLNPSGSIGFGLNIVSAPGGAPGHVEATVSLPAASGTWRDSAGHAGTFVFTPGAGTGGSPRPTTAPPVTIGATGIDPAQVQLRISGSCTAGLFMQSIGQNGTVGCAAAGGGVTGVTAGPGLAGGGTTGTVPLALRTVGAGTFDFANTNGIVAAGTYGAGSIGASGAGSRLLWYPRKAAFRAGFASNTMWDDANIGDYSAATGLGTTASGPASTAMGSGTIASGSVSTAMGVSTRASGAYSTALGFYTTASGDYGTAFGNSTTAGGRGSLAAGSASVAGGIDAIALGLRAVANGTGSVVLGSDATASTPGMFMFGDRSTTNDLTTFGSNEFLVRAAGGTVFYSDAAMTNGVVLNSGLNAWAPINVSDENRKTDFRDLDGEQVLGKLAALPVREWRYTTQDAGIRHVGPTAQDFRAAFGLGESDVRIGSVDADGIALAGVKALETRTRATSDALAQQNELLTREVADLRARLARLETLLDKR